MTTTASMNTPWGNVTIYGDTSVIPLGGDEWLARGTQVSIDHPFGSTSFYRNGWNSWSPTGWRKLSDPPLRIYDNPERLLTADDASRDIPNQHAGSLVGALELPDGNILLLGALSLGAPIVGADAHELWGHSECDDAVWFIAWGSELEIFEHYASLVRARWGSRTARAGNVWSSWYSFFEDIDERRLGDAVADLADYPFDVVQVDDGWQESVGDWTVNEKFPSGLAALATRIGAAGFRAGLWMAPLICVPTSAVAQEHPEWLVQASDGTPLIGGYNWGTHYFVLDTTQPEVQAHLRRVFADLVAAGFTYFKLDFMYAGALPGSRSATSHREEVYREAAQLIRKAVGETVYLLGSGIPMLASVGIFDGARVGADVAPYWDNTERHGDQSGPGAYNSMANTTARFWMKRWYEIDPDVVFFRTRRTLLNDRAMQALLDVATVAGFTATSDPIAWLDPQERTRLREFLTHHATVEHVARNRFTIDGRSVDFEEQLSGAARDLESMLVK